MDATYKTTRYELPLFFISFRTNTQYCVVSEFIVQSESAAHIEEKLPLQTIRGRKRANATYRNQVGKKLKHHEQ